MNDIESLSQTIWIDLLTTRSHKGDPEALFELGKILWEQQQINAAKFYLNEASKRGFIEAEKFLNHASRT